MEITGTAGKMNHRDWNLNKGKELTLEQHKKQKKLKPHQKLAKRRKWNKKHGLLEKTKKGSRKVIFEWSP